jgi:hypothetical protein
LQLLLPASGKLGWDSSRTVLHDAWSLNKECSQANAGIKPRSYRPLLLVLIDMANCLQEALAVYCRMWMDKVLQPLNEKAASIIAEHIDLLDARHVVPELLQLVAHVNTMRVILHKWEFSPEMPATARLADHAPALFKQCSAILCV